MTEQRFPLRRVKTIKTPLNHNHTEMVEGRISWGNKTKEYRRGELGIYTLGRQIRPNKRKIKENEQSGTI